MSYQTGDVVRFGNASAAEGSAAFTTLADVATDPTTVTLVITKPDASQLIYGWPAAGLDGTLTRESTGRFYCDVPLDMDGQWWQALAGTGAVETVEESAILVRRRRSMVTA